MKVKRTLEENKIVEKINQIYKCEICGNIIEVLTAGGGELICCGQPMKLLSEKEEDAGKEKHVPVMGKIENGVKVKVGSIEHPMEEKHYIQWIEVIRDDLNFRKFLKPGMKPEAEFCIKKLPKILLLENSNFSLSKSTTTSGGILNPDLEIKADKISARIYCNIYGLWKSK